MAKTKEQILNEKKIEIETQQLPSKLQLDKLESLKEILTATIPMSSGFVDEQKGQSIWDDDEIIIIKHKILAIIRDL